MKFINVGKTTINLASIAYVAWEPKPTIHFIGGAELLIGPDSLATFKKMVEGLDEPPRVRGATVAYPPGHQPESAS